MDRRRALMNLGIISGGLVLLPSCEFSKEKATIALNNLKISASQENLLKDITSSIIPNGEIPGALELKVDEFVWVMLDDCFSKEGQEEFLKGLNSFNDAVTTKSGSFFNKLTEKERSSIMQSLEESAPVDENDKVGPFLKTLKQLCIFGFMQSEFIMTEVMPYSLVPGKYGVCETIDPKKRINVNG
ncbi:gluconate 2-dehydrogenase subunit 3 family protein [Lutimonas saemankumensis]|uniref:gluconate 2-dehydrogenase subunit 3 family protein n=1 Tax=Lutimonas saemankumensis TaxID=483016 RepID=UPI001CD5927D|nr:gluconate 2-dehydrogenase subunit 3 family protein [Lutimonas saemankumensis]MCA0933408.1 gluconate 2-dehydrogenase subunit 3 family protein [Lutimonas saemankumensis]